MKQLSRFPPFVTYQTNETIEKIATLCDISNKWNNRVDCHPSWHIKQMKKSSRLPPFVTYQTNETIYNGHKLKASTPNHYTTDAVNFCITKLKYCVNTILKKTIVYVHCRIRIMCPSGPTCLPADCCVSELALLKSDSACCCSTKWTSSSLHWKLTCSHQDIVEKLLSWR
jgi:ribosomal protein L39E